MIEAPDYLVKGRERAASGSSKDDVFVLELRRSDGVDIDLSQDSLSVDSSLAAWKAGEEERKSSQMSRPDLEEKKSETKSKNDKPNTTQVECEKKGRSSITGKVVKCVVFVATFVHFVSPISIGVKAEAPIADFKQSAAAFIQAKKENLGFESGNFYRVACATVAQKNKNLDVTNGYAVTADPFRKKKEQEGSKFEYMDERLKGVEITDEMAKACAVSFDTQVSCGKKIMFAGGEKGLLIFTL